MTFSTEATLLAALLGGSAPIELADFLPRLPQPDDRGRFEFEVKIREETPPGHYRLQVRGPGSDGSLLELTADLEVIACQATTTTAPPPATTPDGGELPRTGSDNAWSLSLIGLALAALGAMLLTASRRRHRTQASS